LTSWKLWTSFSEGLAFNKTHPTEKMKRIKVLEALHIYKFGSVHFWYMTHPKKLGTCKKKRVQTPKFP
jgi:hypothetical protein